MKKSEIGNAVSALIWVGPMEQSKHNKLFLLLSVIKNTTHANDFTVYWANVFHMDTLDESSTRLGIGRTFLICACALKVARAY